MTLDEFFTAQPDWRKHADLIAVPPTAAEIQAEFPDCDRDVLDRCEHGLPSIGALYVRVRREGAKDRWASMLALQQAPRIMTDNVFFAGMKRLGDTFDAGYLKNITTAAQRHGYKPNPTDIYQPGLARFRGDPEAFVPGTGGRGYIKSLCEKRGWACEGTVNLEAREPTTDPKNVPLAENLIRSNARNMIKKDPSLKRLNRRELRELVVARHGAKR